MSNCVAFHQQLAFLIRPQFPKFPVVINKRNSLLQQRKGIRQFVPKAAASTSVGGSGAEYSEPLLGGTKPKKKREKIAGIDQDELLEPALLADPDSCFCEFNGIQIHHKVYDAESAAQNLLREGTSFQSLYQTKKISLPMILLHGFGASVYSWSRVMKPLAQATGSKVLAFDRPAFGLTSRVNSLEHLSTTESAKPLNPYSMMFSVLATLYFINSLAAQKAILVGHSAGSLVAVQTYLEAPERIAALILVAPAILASLSFGNIGKQNKFGMNNQNQEGGSNSYIQENPFVKVFSILSKFFRYIAQALTRLGKGMMDMFNSLYKKALAAFLRSAIAVMLVRMVIDKFGIAGVGYAWYDSNKVTDHVLQGYTKPLRTKGWDRALLEYTASMLTDSSEPNIPLSKRLKEISCPVLIVTGDNDRIVPAWNAEALSRAIPGSCLEVIKYCGHLPQEERAEEFVAVVDKFLQTVFGGLQAQHLQAAI